MEKVLLHQKFSFCVISPYRNYSKLVDKPKNLGLNTFDTESINIDEKAIDITEREISIYNKYSEYKQPNFCFYLTSINKHNKNRQYFYSDVVGEDIYEKLTIKPVFKKRYNFHFTTNDRQIKQHYNDPFSELRVYIFERKIKIDGDKISINLYHSIKFRDINRKFFKKQGILNVISINKKTGNITLFTKTSKGGKSIRTNYFNQLLSEFFLNRFLKPDILLPDFFTHEKIKDKCTNVLKEFKDNLNDEEYFNVLKEVLEIKSSFSQVDGENVETVRRGLVDLFIKMNKIKSPDNFNYNIFKNAYPKKTFLRSNDNKLISAFLDSKNLKTKYFIKLFHKFPNINFNRIFELREIFGEEHLGSYLSNISEKFYEFIETENDYGIFDYQQNFPPILNNEKYKKIVLKLINELIEKNYIPHQFIKKYETLITEIRDHYRMLSTIVQVFPNVDANATTLDNFKREHLEFSKLEMLVNKRKYTSLIYDELTINTIETPIIDGDIVFYPVILKNSIDYLFEGKHMHHCVGGYINDQSSIVISIRMNSKNDAERITCEFGIATKKLRQAKYFTNQNPPPIFHSALEILIKRITEIESPLRVIDKKTELLNIDVNVTDNTDILIPF